MPELLLDPEIWVAFFTLTMLELVLGIDNIIFISILVDQLPREQREFTRRIGLFLAMFMRIALLALLFWFIGLTKPLFTILTEEISWRDIILIGGGLFLIWKSTKEVHQLLAGEGDSVSIGSSHPTFHSMIIQIIMIDLVFSLDSIITAIGIAEYIEVMIAAVIASVFLMMAFAGVIGRFISENPTIKMLALAFLFLIGVLLIADGFNHHVPRGYVYFAMAFSVCVEMLNMHMFTRVAKTQRNADKFDVDGN